MLSRPALKAMGTMDAKLALQSEQIVASCFGRLITSALVRIFGLKSAALASPWGIGPQRFSAGAVAFFGRGLWLTIPIATSGHTAVFQALTSPIDPSISCQGYCRLASLAC
jgi:hypothetical protein